MDIRKVATFADYFVICSAQTDRQLRAIRNGIDEALGREGMTARAQEGTVESGWVLMDFGDVIVHIFALEQREHYKLERLWGDAITLLRLQ